MLTESRDKADLNPSHLLSRLILLVAVVSCSITTTLDAQEGTIQGRVRDQQGAAVFGAVVRLLSDTTLIGMRILTVSGHSDSRECLRARTA
ncbi:MAG: hypothetical protein Ct9H300mP15_06310 [Gemmatimonadota bacterium]|nr:MAG: hypothetical protein Ct9H300mP15_06310 [Gemmatimonadota bacterium]